MLQISKLMKIKMIESLIMHLLLKTVDNLDELRAKVALVFIVEELVDVPVYSLVEIYKDTIHITEDFIELGHQRV